MLWRESWQPRLNMNQEEVIWDKKEMVFSSWWWMHVSVHTSDAHEKSRYLSKRWITVFSFTVVQQTNSVHFLTSPAGRELLLLLRGITLGCNHSTAHCSVMSSRHSVAVLHKATFVFTLLISPGNILMTSKKMCKNKRALVWQICDLKKDWF